MWPYMLSGLACGSRIILYDGSPFYPSVKNFLRLVDEQEYVRSLAFNTASTHMFLPALRISVRALASYLRFKAAESSHSVSFPAPPFRPAIGTFVGDVGRFEALRRVFSTGAVLTAPQFEWAQRAFNDRLMISSGSGGTDICCCCECPLFPIVIHFHIMST